MTSFDLENVAFILNPRYRLQWEAAQNCYVLLYPEGLIQLSESAAEVMQRCATATTLSALLDDLQHEYPDADLEDDVREFLQEAQQQHWIVPVE